MKPGPEPDPLTEPFWEAARRGRLVIQRCGGCRRFIHYPRVVCPSCLSHDLAFEEASGRGSIYSFTWAHRPAGRAFADALPYLVVLVELEEGVRLMTTIPGADPDAVVVGAPVHLLRFEPTADDGPPVPVFALT